MALTPRLTEPVNRVCGSDGLASDRLVVELLLGGPYEEEDGLMEGPSTYARLGHKLAPDGRRPRWEAFAPLDSLA